ncbi:type II secretion system protein [Reinekea marinisedimentorum]|uniref:Prepilin-type N-terminal cleavage/methylation domain-containing protein n=1 Tax=Reinekea marinisedimentorum TaxID=230495 RepID=A0A4R3I6P3_9GAMM|nr:type II secretion system protein [Reinekea marinisedimentorum]TCS41646.1 prepilin-type N-terminal cleavage/methylation domain-containing protein [Reinekea marinisedimentorum]
MKKPNPKQTGFTLTELIIVIVIMGILGAVITPLIGNKFSAAYDSTQRAGWVQQAEFALVHMRRDLANSVPNSVYIDDGNDTNVEFLTAPASIAVYAARYRDKNYVPYDNLKLNNDDGFDIFGSYSEVPGYVSVGLSSASDIWEASLGDLGSLPSNIPITEVASSSTGSGENSSPIATIVLGSSHTFPDHSSYYRAYFFDGIVGYQCDASSGYLYRYSGYDSLDSAATFSTRTSGGQQDRVISNVQSCSFELIGGSVYNPPALRVEIEIGNSEESIQLVDTILLSNAS